MHYRMGRRTRAYAWPVESVIWACVLALEGDLQLFELATSSLRYGVDRSCSPLGSFLTVQFWPTAFERNPIRMVVGLLRADCGRLETFGHDPWDNPEIRKLMGVVYEKAFFPSHQKTLDYLRRVCRIYGMPESRALEVLRMVQLEYAKDRPIKGLSAGMLQKFAIAHSMINHPQLVIADEMTSNLDPQARSSLLDLVLQLRREEKVTFLLSSHILPELSRVCDSVAIINWGKVLASGNVTELYSTYSSGTVRITTDKPDALAVELRMLPS